MDKRFSNPPKKQSYFFFGPRGSGETTFLNNKYPNTLVFNLFLEKRFQELAINPEIFFEEILALSKPQTIVVGEVQRLPDLLNYVHELIDKRINKAMLDSSSSAPKSRTRKTSSTGLWLTGRALFMRLSIALTVSSKSK